MAASAAASAKPAASAGASASAKPAAAWRNGSAAAKPAASGTAPLRVAYSAATASQSASWIAQDEGFWTKYGFTADVRSIKLAPLAITALLAGAIDVAQAGGDGLIAAKLKGSPVVEIASLKNALTGALMARPGVDKLDQVKKISVSRIGSNTHYLAVQALKRNNIDPKTVTFIQSGSGANDVAALSTGQVDAAAAVPPDDLAAQHQGAHQLLDMTALKIPYPATTLVVTQDTLKNKPDVVRRVLQAYGEAMHTYFSNPARAQEIIGKWTKLDDKEAIQDAYNSEKQVLEPELTPRPEAVQAYLDDAATTDPEAKNLRPEQLIDATILNQLVQAGFFKGL